MRKTRETYSVSLEICRLWAIFPGRRQPSIFATAALNFRVRNGNGWTHCVKITDSFKLSPELFFCVSVELSSRAVASQVFSPLQRLTSVFGMGTGGPTALKTLTHTVRYPFCLDLVPAFPSGSIFGTPLNYPWLDAHTVGWCTSGDSNPGPTD